MSAATLLRAAARLAGVSHNAPYRHFRNQESILAALAARGLAELGDGRIALILDVPTLIKIGQGSI